MKNSEPIKGDVRETGEDFGNMKPSGILVAICSCHGYSERRSAVRETWMSQNVEGITPLFFVGKGSCAEPDTICVEADDSYEALPEKVVGFFRWAIENHDFEWLFKCDDDTYLALDRLSSIIDPRYDLIGDPSVDNRGAPSGGAGYLLSRRAVSRLIEDNLPKFGAEDLIVGHAIQGYGLPTLSRRVLSMDSRSRPTPENDVVTAHWCPPKRLRRIHSVLTGETPSEATVITVWHENWGRDELAFYDSGYFERPSTGCEGEWEDLGGDYRSLNWDAWDREFLRMDTSPPTITKTRDTKKPVKKTIWIELAGGLGNQLFQYAAGFGLARLVNGEVRLGHIGWGRPFALGGLGLALDNSPPDCGLTISEWGPADLSLRDRCRTAIRDSDQENVKLSGYFQHESFFSDIAEEFKETMAIEPISLEIEKGRHRVCVHVRRGDFVGNAIHDLCGIDYYLGAKSLMGALCPKPIFAVFSDDLDW